MNAIRTRKWLLLIPVVLAVVIAGSFGLGPALRGGSHQEETPATTTQTEVAVTVAEVTPREVERGLEVVGTLLGYEEVNVGAKVEGRIVRIHHEVGDSVAPGTPLLELDDTDYRLAVLEAERGLELELARLGLRELPTEGKIDLTRVPSVMRARNLEENARQVMDRAKRLGIGRVIGAEEWERAQTEARVASSNREQAELEARAILASARLRQAQVESARQKVRDCCVCVPCPSAARMPPGCKDSQSLRYIVASRKVAEGEMIRGMPAATLFQLVIDHPLKLLATVPERFLSELRVGQRVTLGVEAYPEQTFEGTIVRLNPTIERSNRTFTIEVQVPNESRKLRPGSFVKARVQTRQADRALTVPEQAIVRFAGVVKLFTVENDRARAHPVQTGEVLEVKQGDRYARWIEIKGNLRPGVKVVTSGQSQLAEGTPVRVR